MNEKNSVATSATSCRMVSMRKMSKALNLLHKNISKSGVDDTKNVEATTVATESGFMLNFLGEDFNLSINLVVLKGGKS